MSDDKPFDREYADKICSVQETFAKMPEAKIEDCEGNEGPCPLNGPIHVTTFCLRQALQEIDRLNEEVEKYKRAYEREQELCSYPSGCPRMREEIAAKNTIIVELTRQRDNLECQLNQTEEERGVLLNNCSKYSTRMLELETALTQAKEIAKAFEEGDLYEK